MARRYFASMGSAKAVALAALLLACAPAAAQEIGGPNTTLFYVRVPLGGLEVKWLVAGGVAVAAAAAVHSRGKDREEQHQRAQEEQRREQQESCQKVC